MSAAAVEAGKLARLALVLHGAIPPVTFIVIINSIVNDKTIKLFTFFFKLLPNCRVFIHYLFVLFNCAFPAATVYALRGCDERCLPQLSLIVVALLLLLWTDRFVESIIGSNSANSANSANSTFVTRVAAGGAIVGLLIAVSEGDDLWPCYVVLCLLNRPTGIDGSPVKILDVLSRFALCIYSTSLVYYSDESNASKKLWAVLLAVAGNAKRGNYKYQR